MGARDERKFYKDLALSLEHSGSEKKKAATGENKIAGEAVGNTGT